MFQGRSALSLDAKGRMTIPARLRTAFVEEDGMFVTLTRHPDGCLLMYQRSVWVVRRQELANLPMAARQWQRMFLGNASEQEIDASGRVLIPPELREAVGLDREVVLMGLGTRFEIWDAARLKHRDDALDGEAMPDAIAGFQL
jgi:MraZ protein